MPERGRDETRELLVGTWIGIALIAEILIQQGADGAKMWYRHCQTPRRCRGIGAELR